MATTVTKTVKSSGGDYTSLSGWEAGQQKDCVAADEIQRAEVYAFTDGTAVTIAGWTTDATRYCLVEPVDATARATMPWDTAKYVLSQSAAANTFTCTQNYTQIFGLQIEKSGTAGGSAAVIFNCTGGIMDGCYGWHSGNKRCAVFEATVVVRNCTFTCSGGTQATISTTDPSSAVTLQNVTAFTGGTGTGVAPAGSNTVATNVLSYGGTCYSGTFSGSSDYNASSDTTAPGTTKYTSIADPFANLGAGDYHLSAAGKAALPGTSLSGSFTSDFDRDTRTSWSVGADDGPVSTAAGRRWTLDDAPVPIRPGLGPWSRPFMPREFRSRTNPTTPLQYQTGGGTITPAGALVMQTGKPVGGTSTPAGAMIRTTTKNPAGSVTPVGGNTTLVGKPLAGTVTSAGAVSKTAGKLPTGTVTPAGAMIRTTGKFPAGSVSPAGGLVKLIGRLITGSTAPVGSVLKSIATLLAGAITPSSTLATTKVILLSIAGSIASAGSLVRSVGKNPSGSVTPVGAIRRDIGKSFQGSIAPTGTIQKVIGRLIVGALSLAGTLLAQIVGDTTIGPPYGLELVDPARTLVFLDPARGLTITDPDRTLDWS